MKIKFIIQQFYHGPFCKVALFATFTRASPCKRDSKINHLTPFSVFARQIPKSLVAEGRPADEENAILASRTASQLW